MLLSTQLFDRIAGISNETPGHVTVLPVGCRRMPERRAASRIAFGHRTQICRDGGRKAGVWDTVMLQDISFSGIGYICHETMSVGETFVLKLLDREGQSIRIRCKVARCERGGFGQSAFVLGATFEQVIQHMLRVNDDEEDSDHSSRKTATDSVDLPVTTNGHGLKNAGFAMARAAVELLKAVDPIRAAAQWMHRADDFSSV